ncbi:hypothetical protein IB213_02410 [Comamonas sp. CMM02]|nr:hypothetical protein [Comamonas sp. CMM02]
MRAINAYEAVISDTFNTEKLAALALIASFFKYRALQRGPAAWLLCAAGCAP